ncbi:MAG: hypothetical protein AAF902_08805 [Chloroflexota bacterium]
MQTKLKSSIHVESLGNNEQNAYAISASILTRQGSELQVAAISQKKPGDYASIDTPRKTLLSFVNNLQSGGNSQVEQLIQRAIGLVHISTGGYIKRHGGAPCGLVAAILLEDQLYTLQVGSGAILLLHSSKLSLLTHPKLIKAPADAVWLGEPNEFPINSINFKQGRLETDSSIIICQPGFLRGMQSKRVAFQDAVTSFMENSEDVAQDIAHWSQANQIQSDLTMAVHSLVEDNGRVEFASSMSSESTLNLLDDFEQNGERVKSVEPSSQPHTSGEEPEESTANGILNKVIEAVQEKAEAGSKDGKIKTSDTIRTAALPLEAVAPVTPNGNGASAKAVESTITATESESPPKLNGNTSAGSTNETAAEPSSRLYRTLMISVIGLFAAMILMGGFVVLQRVILNEPTSTTNSQPIQAVAVAEAAESSEVLAPSGNLDNTVGSWSQGASESRKLLDTEDELGARGLIHVTINPNGGTDPSQTTGQDVYAWAGSELSFDNISADASFEVSENSTLFLDSTKSTIRPSLTRLFGVAESSSGCMSIKYGEIDQPLVMTCYSGTCRWLGPLSRTYDIQPGQRLTIASNPQSANPAIYEPINYDETIVFARTLGGTANGKDITDQCLAPFVAEGRQLTEAETADAVASMSGNFSQEIGFWSLGNTGFRILVDKGDTVNARGLIRLALDTGQNGGAAEEDVNIYAWAGSKIHFDPKLAEDQVEVREGSTVFLDSTDSTVRPFLAGLFGTAESIDGCMSITYSTKDQPLVLSCYSGSCNWNGALSRNFTIPAGQRLSLEPNPQAQNPAIFEPIYRTETLVASRTLGSIDEGRALANQCVEPYLVEAPAIVTTPQDEEDDETVVGADDEETNVDDEETVNDEVEASSTVPPLETPTVESEASSDDLGANSDVLSGEETPEPDSDDA